jgi:hypothetical protein
MTMLLERWALGAGIEKSARISQHNKHNNIIKHSLILNFRDTYSVWSLSKPESTTN